MKELYFLTITRDKLNEAESRSLVFSSEYDVKEWLLSNGFYFGRDKNTVYDRGSGYWLYAFNNPIERYKAEYMEIDSCAETPLEKLFESEDEVGDDGKI